MRHEVLGAALTHFESVPLVNVQNTRAVLAALWPWKSPGWQ